MKYEKGSFVTVPNKQKLEEMDAASQSVFFWICSHANEKGQCYPSIKRLARLCKLSRNTLKNRLGRLEKAGLIKKIVRRSNQGYINITNLYQVLIVKGKGRSSNDREGSAIDRGASQGMATNSIHFELNPINENIATQKLATSKSYLVSLPEEDVAELMKKYQIDKTLVLRKADDVLDYCEANNKHYANYKVALNIFIKQELKKSSAGYQIRNSTNFIKAPPGKYDHLSK